ncbi:hypothetical protein BELL_0072g00200 [Botrytis elliptica]|uniref:Uncharacterized protein n=1 Tax=Botrytis elliptica TaxID=278938 RepID=A0A4Z1JXL8_9HELO|nr:hypothetical protein BELL_0072g00200 [Botrytis elliptica]
MDFSQPRHQILTHPVPQLSLPHLPPPPLLSNFQLQIPYTPLLNLHPKRLRLLNLQRPNRNHRRQTITPRRRATHSHTDPAAAESQTRDTIPRVDGIAGVFEDGVVGGGEGEGCCGGEPRGGEPGCGSFA